MKWYPRYPKPSVLTGALLLAGLCFVAFRTFTPPALPAAVVERDLNAPVTMCGSFEFDWADTTAAPARLLPGLGELRFRITTRSPEAQEFFNQGLRLVYAFNHWEAIQSFRQALRLDPECAMAAWGLALAYGPNLNDVNPQDREQLAFNAIQLAQSKMENSTAFEQVMIGAMARRYDGKAYDDRDSLNRAYAQAMREVAQKFPAEAEALTLCADAIMNTMPWNYWEADGSPKADTREAKAMLEDAMKKFPQHPGAHHLYIHLVEASPNPDQALASAKVLENAMPGAGHIVHMPAHIYVRTGDYDRSIRLNERAAMVDEEYLAASENSGFYRLMYYPHNVDFISFSAYMEGRSDLGVRTAMKLAYKGSLVATANPTFGQYLMAEPMIAFTRFGKWSDILSLPEPAPELTYLHVIWRFSRGMALLRTGHAGKAAAELAKLDSLSAVEGLGSFYFSFNPASDIVQVPLHLLRGEVMLKEGKTDAGIRSLQEAVAKEDALRYNEPPDWKLFSRHYLGGALLDAGRHAEAEKVFAEDLARNRENGWSLKGLEMCQAKSGNKAGRAATLKRLDAAWKRSDTKLPSSRF